MRTKAAVLVASFLCWYVLFGASPSCCSYPSPAQAVLVENAFVIQLWHYTEHAYFKGASVMAATVIAYRCLLGQGTS